MRSLPHQQHFARLFEIAHADAVKIDAGSKTAGVKCLLVSPRLAFPIRQRVRFPTHRIEYRQLDVRRMDLNLSRKNERQDEYCFFHGNLSNVQADKFFISGGLRRPLHDFSIYIIKQKPDIEKIFKRAFDHIDESPAAGEKSRPTISLTAATSPAPAAFYLVS